MAPALALCLALAGCASGEGLDGAFGGQDVGVATGTGVNNTSGRLVVGSGANAIEYECPSVTVRSGAASWQVTEKDGGLRYQGNIGQLARECSISGATMLVKVGIQGRLLLGDKGTPGKFEAPIRIAVVQEGPNPVTVATKFFVVPLEIPEGQTSAGFTVVEDQISFPLLKPAEMERYVIYVGFDPQGAPKQTSSSRSSKPRSTSSSSSSSSSSRPKPPASSSSSSSSSSASRSKSTGSDPGAPQGDVFGPPPARSSTSSPPSGGFGPPPSSSTSSGGFAPPPN